MITSTANQQMKNVMQLQKKSKTRYQQRVFVVEGPKMVFEAPRDWVEKIYVSQSFLQDGEHMQTLKQSGCEYEEVSDSVYKAISETKTPQGILAVVKMPQYTLEQLLQPITAKTQEEPKPHLLILEGIQDPGNLGTMLRTGEGAGITGIIMNKNTVDIFNPKVIRSTMGSMYRVPFFIAEDFKETLVQLKQQGIRLYAAHLKGTQSYDRPDYIGGTGFLIGNEGNGLSEEIAEFSDEYIRIPMEGKVESLNAAIAATLLMYEVHRQRHQQ